MCLVRFLLVAKRYERASKSLAINFIRTSLVKITTIEGALKCAILSEQFLFKTSLAYSEDATISPAALLVPLGVRRSCSCRRPIGVEVCHPKTVSHYCAANLSFSDDSSSDSSLLIHLFWFAPSGSLPSATFVITVIRIETVLRKQSWCS